MNIIHGFIPVYVFILIVSFIVYSIRAIVWFNKKSEPRVVGDSFWFHVFICGWSMVPILTTAFGVAVLCCYFIASILF